MSVRAWYAKPWALSIAGVGSLLWLLRLPLVCHARSHAHFLYWLSIKIETARSKAKDFTSVDKWGIFQPNGQSISALFKLRIDTCVRYYKHTVLSYTEEGLYTRNVCYLIILSIFRLTMWIIILPVNRVLTVFVCFARVSEAFFNLYH